MKDYKVLLYYKYQNIENPEQFRQEHLKFCNKIGLKGRIIVGYEGINGTVSGTIEQTEKYKDYVHSLEGFEIYGSKRMKLIIIHIQGCQ